MINHKNFPVLFIDDELHADNAEGRASRAIIKELKNLDFSVIEALEGSEGLLILSSSANISCIILDWDLKTKAGEATPLKMIETIREHSEKIPIFLITEKLRVDEIPLDVVGKINGYVWRMEDTPDFIAGRIEQAALAYLEDVLPPFFKELLIYANEFKYAWHTPGHMGGVAFLKSAPGRAFFDFFGENVLRSDLSVSVPELGSLLEHTEVVGKAEDEAAKTFGADKTYFVTNGTSTANKIVFHGCVSRGDVVLVDRNCHKSIMHAIIMTGAIPIYLIPTRNQYGIIGPIHVAEFNQSTINKKIAESPLIKTKVRKVKHAVVTNSTYDGLCYNAEMIKAKLNNIAENIHFDEAWYGYAKFHHIYDERYGMYEGGHRNAPPVFATQSTHKVLAAFSQGSMVHARDGKKKIDHDRFNEAFMMHTSTSPQYGIIASLDVAAKMMAAKSGKRLVEDSIEEAIIFRKKMDMVAKETMKSGKFKSGSKWWFKVWQPEKTKLDIKAETWVLKAGDKWHGFGGMEKNYIMLDPIKVTILTPGIGEDGKVQKWGIPAGIVSLFLRTRGVVAEKTGFYSLLFLFTMGITKGKSGTLLSELFEFKRLYDKDVYLEEMFPELVKDYPDKYKNVTIQEFCNDMHEHLKNVDIAEITKDVYATMPPQKMIPADTYAEMVKGNVELTDIKGLMNRTCAAMIVPYPPGIPVIMPGEKFTKETKNIIDYLSIYEEFDNRYPGFENEVHGVTVKEDKNKKKTYYMYCLS